MSSQEAKRLVVLSLFIAGGLAFVRLTKDKKTAELPRALFGIAVAGMFLGIMAEFMPQVAGPLAATVAVSTVFFHPEDIIALAANRAKQ